MSGHNKWSQIKHQKAVEDAKKSKLFSMLARIITVESRHAKGDRNLPSLRTATEKARAANMPTENIERAIKRGVGGESGELAEVTYESYGPGGAALIIDGITDNKNRTTAEIKHLLSQYELALAAPGAVLWAFERTADGWRAKTALALAAADREKLAEVIAALEEHVDVKNIFTNAELPKS